MTPKQQDTLEGQQSYFWNLSEKMLERAELEEGEIEESDTPSEKELDILTSTLR